MIITKPLPYDNIHKEIHTIPVTLNLVGGRGEKGEKGEEGKRGFQGLPGFTGDSAYEVALKNGFKGTETEWLLSLKGEKGDSVKGEKGDPGIQGVQGVPGKDGISFEKVLLWDNPNGLDTPKDMVIQLNSAPKNYSFLQFECYQNRLHSMNSSATYQSICYPVASASTGNMLISNVTMTLLQDFTKNTLTITSNRTLIINGASTPITMTENLNHSFGKILRVWGVKGNTILNGGTLV